MPASSPRSIRLDPDTQERVQALADATDTSAANLMASMVREGAAMRDHPGITFRDGPTGRRAGLDGGPDVWEIAARVNELRDDDLQGEDLLDVLHQETDVPASMLRRAVAYWADHPEEIDRRLELQRQSRERLAEQREAANRLLS